MPVLFEVPALHCSRVVQFLVDTGSTYSAITEKEAILLGIEIAVLPEAKKGAVGFGGTFKNKIINYPVFLRFKSPTEEYKITYGNGFQIICIPPNLPDKEREIWLRYCPCVLGMEVLRKFQVYVDKRKVELTVV